MVYEIAVSPGDSYIFAATDAGPYMYYSQTNQWYDMAQNAAPDQVYWTVDLDLATQTVRFGTYGRGIWDFKITDGLVNIEGNHSSNLDLFPNPANDFIEIISSSNEIKIYSLYGKVMKIAKPGKIDISDLASGVYFAKDGKNSQRFIKY
jgi:hypothetical protein